MFYYPFTIVSGGGLGLKYSSLERNGVLVPSESLGQARIVVSVNAANGNVIVKDHFFEAVERNEHIQLGYVYNSQTPVKKSPAERWHFALETLDVSQMNNKRLILTEADGHQTVFTHNGSLAAFLAPACGHGRPRISLDSTRKQWVYYNPGTRHSLFFNEKGLLVEKRDSAGHASFYRYDEASALLQSITGDSGTVYSIKRKITGTQKQVLIFMKEPGQKSPELYQAHIFSEKGLQRTAFLNGYSINYDYNSEGLLEKVSQTDQTFFSLFYEKGSSSAYQIARFLRGNDKNSYSFEYAGQVTRISNVGSQLIEVAFESKDVDRKITALRQSVGIGANELVSTEYEYTNVGFLSKITTPDGAVHIRQYHDISGLCIFKSSPNQQKVYLLYDEKTGAKIFEKRVLREAKDGTVIYLSHYFIYDNNYQGTGLQLLRFVLTPSGKVTEYQYNLRKDIAIKRVYLDEAYTNKEFTNKSYSNHEALYADLEKWVGQYRLQHPQGIALSTYRYDIRGLQIEETTYTAIDMKGNGVKNDSMGLIKWHRRHTGEWVFQAVGQKSALRYIENRTFDILGRMSNSVKGTSEAIKQTTTISYDDKSSTKTICQPNGMLNKQLRDPGGFVENTVLIGKNGDLTEQRQTQFMRDALGRAIISAKPGDKKTYTLYDKKNQLRFLIKPCGEVVEYLFDEKNNYKKTVYYATPINLKKLVGRFSPIPTVNKVSGLVNEIKDPLKDRHEYQVYDESQRLCFDVDADAFLVEYRYDRASRMTHKIHYCNSLTKKAIEELLQKKLTLNYDIKVDSVWLYLYNEDNFKTFERDPAGFVTQYSYDHANRLMKKTHYATQVPEKVFFNSPIPKPTPQDAAYRYYRDAKGQIVAELDAEGYLVERTFLSTGKIASEYLFSTRVTVDPSAVSDWSDLRPKKDTKHDRFIQSKYDELGRKIFQAQANKKEVKPSYNKMNNVLAVETRDGDASSQTMDPNEQRRTLSRYNQFEDVLATCPPLVAQVLLEKKTEKEKEAVWENQSVRFTFDPFGLKSKEIDTLGNKRLFFYNDNRQRVLSVEANGLVEEQDYDAFGNSVKKRQYVNRLTQQQFDTLANSKNAFITDAIKALLVPDDAKDIVTQFSYDKRDNLTKTVDPEGYVTEKTYNYLDKETRSVRQFTKSNALIEVSQAYDLRGLLIESIRRGGSLVIQKRYARQNFLGLVNVLTDEEGNIHRYEYDRLGQQLKVIDPNNVVEHERVYDAFGQIIADKNALGFTTFFEFNVPNRTQVIKPPLFETQWTVVRNIFSEKMEEIKPLEQEQRWSYAPNGVVVSMQTLIDTARKRVTSKQLNTEGLALVTVDTLGFKTAFSYNSTLELVKKTVDTDDLKLTTLYTRDSFGRMSQMKNPKHVVTAYTYDRRSLVVSECLDLGTNINPGLCLLKQTEYNGIGTAVHSYQGDQKEKNQYEVLYVQDALGRSIGKTVDPDNIAIPQVNLSLTQLNTLDKKSRVVSHTDPMGYISYFFYDNTDNKRFHIKADGSVVEWEYNALKKAIARRVYSTKLSTQVIDTIKNIGDLEKVLVKTPEDALYGYVFDENTRERFILTRLYNAQSEKFFFFIQEKRYDAASRVVAEIGYADFFVMTSVDAFPSYDALIELTEKNNNPKNRWTFSVFNIIGNERFTIDPQGAISEYVYDKKGRIIERIRYADVISSLSERKRLAALPPEKLQDEIKIDVNSDRHDYTIWNVFNKAAFLIDPEYTVTRYQYDSLGGLIETCVFATPLPKPKNYADVLQMCNALKPDPKRDRLTVTRLNSVGQQAEKIDALGYKEIFEHDALGNVVKLTNKVGFIWEYTYDRVKRLTLEKSPPVNVTQTTLNNGSAITAVDNNRPIYVYYEYDKNNNAIKTVKDYQQDLEIKTEPRVMLSNYNPLNVLEKTIAPNVEVDAPQKKAGFNEPPVKKVDIVSCRTYDAQSRLVAEQHEDGLWSFTVYDSAGRKAFFLKRDGSLTAYEWDVFGGLLTERVYEKRLTLDTTPYTQTGIPQKIILQNIVSSPDSDRTSQYLRDFRGDLIGLIRDKALYYFPGSSAPAFAKANVSFVNNAFRERSYVEKARFPGVAKQLDYSKRFWHDRAGRIIAEAESIQSGLVNDQLQQTPIEYRVVRYRYNTAADKVETKRFANTIKQAVRDLSIAELDQLCTSDPSPKDRLMREDYNLLGQKIRKTRVGVIRQKVYLGSKALGANFSAHMQDYVDILTNDPNLNALFKTLNATEKQEQAKKSEQKKKQAVPHHVGDNKAHLHFTGDLKTHLSQRFFGTHYTAKSCLYFLNLMDNPLQATVMLLEYSERNWREQLLFLAEVSDRSKRPGVFILSHQNNHFLAGCYFNHSLIFLDPLGGEHCRQILIDEKLAVISVKQKWCLYVSQNVFQLSLAGIVESSSGPLAVELASFLLNPAMPERLEKLFSEKAIKKTISIPHQGSTSSFSLAYSTADMISLLPESLSYKLDQWEFMLAVQKLRYKHHDFLKTVPEKLAHQYRLQVDDVLQTALKRGGNSQFDQQCKKQQIQKVLPLEVALEQEAKRQSKMSSAEANDPSQFPNMTDTAPIDVTVEYQYSVTGKECAKRDENGQWAYQYFDSLDRVIAEVGSPVQDQEGQTLWPLTQYTFNAHGQNLRRRHVYYGAASISQDPFLAPAAKLLDASKDQLMLYITDTRGLTAFLQDPEGNLEGYTYLPVKKLARKYYPVTNFVTTTDSFEKKATIDEEAWTFDSAARPYRFRRLRDGVERRYFEQAYNTFGNVTGETHKRLVSNQVYPKYSYYDQLSRVTNSNASGHPRIHLYDLLSQKTAILEDPAQNLRSLDTNQKIYDYFLTGKPLITTFLPDPVGRELARIEPEFIAHQNKAIDTQKIKLPISISRQHPAIGALSMTWRREASASIKPKVYLWRLGDQPATQPILTKEDNDADVTGIDISTFVTDIYQYRIVFVLIDPTSSEETVYYEATGLTQFDTGSYGVGNKKSQHVVAEMENGHELYLSGSVETVTGIQLWKGSVVLNSFPITQRISANKVNVNLENVKDNQGAFIPSGEYQVKVVRGSTVDNQKILPFVLYTETPAAEPLSRSIPSHPQLLVLVDHGQFLIWNTLPTDYQTYPINLSCVYNHYINSTLAGGNLVFDSAVSQSELDAKIAAWKQTNTGTNNMLLIELLDGNNRSWTLVGVDSTNTMVVRAVPSSSSLGQFLSNIDINAISSQERVTAFRESIYFLGRVNILTQFFTITPSTNLGVFKDKSGAEITANLLFNQPPYELLDVSIKVKTPKKGVITLYKDYAPVVGNNAVFEFKNERYYALRFSHTRKAIHSSEKKSILLASSIDTWHFSPRTVLYLNPLQGYSGKTPLAVNYEDVTKGIMLTWDAIPAFDATNQGIMLDITSMRPAQYPYWIDTDQEPYPIFTVTEQGGYVYTSDAITMPKKDNATLKLTRRFDVFDNKIEENQIYVNDIGRVRFATTTHEYNDLDKEIKTTYPGAIVVDSEGISHPGVVTSRSVGYDNKGQKIGLTNPNGYTRVWIYNNAGRDVSLILANGTVSYQRFYNTFGQLEVYQDARGERWLRQHDRSGNITKTTTPEGLVKTYLYNERSKRIRQSNSSKTDNGGAKTRFGYDVSGNKKLIIQPLGGVIRRKFSHNGRLVEEINPGGKKKTWIVNFFGLVKEYTWLDGTRFVNTYDFMKRPTQRISVGGTPRKYLEMKSVRFQDKEGTWYTLEYPVEKDVPPVDLRFYYNGTLLERVEDRAHNAVSTYVYDELKRPIRRSIQLGNGQFVRLTTARFDRRGRQVHVSDTDGSLLTLYDAVGNRRMEIATFTTNGVQLSNDYWYRYNRANLARVVRGKVINGQIQIVNNQGFLLDYQKTFRIQETKIRDGVTYVIGLNYDKDGRVIGSNNTTNNTFTQRSYADQGWVKTYAEGVNSNPTPEVEQLYEVDKNLRQFKSTSKKNGQWRQKTHTEKFTGEGNIEKHAITMPDNGERIDLTYYYDELDSEKNSEVRGSTYNSKGGTKQLEPARLFRDGNGNPNAKQNSDDGHQGSGKHYTPEIVLFFTTHDGLVLRNKRFIKVKLNLRTLGTFWFGNLYFVSPSDDEMIFITPGGSIFGAYKRIGEARENAEFGVRNEPSNTGGNWSVIKADYMAETFGRANRQGMHFVVASPVESLIAHVRRRTFADYMADVGKGGTRESYDKSIATGMSYEPVSPSQFSVPQNNMSLLAISQLATGSENNAFAIAQANGLSMGQHLNLGDLLEIPRLQINTNHYLDNANYQKLMQEIIGSLSPHIDFKKPKRSCWKTIVLVVIAVVSAVAGYFVPGLWAITNMALTALAAAAAAAFANAALQGIAKGLGLIDEFSWKRVLMAAVQAGLQGYFEAAGFASHFANVMDFSKILGQILYAVTVAGILTVTQQLAEMAAGTRKKFDLGELVEAMFMAALNMAVVNRLPPLGNNKYMKAFRNAIVEFKVSLIGHAVLGNSIEIEQLFAQAVGSAVGGVLRAKANNYIEERNKQELIEKLYKSYAAEQGVTPRDNALPNVMRDAQKDPTKKYTRSAENDANSPPDTGHYKDSKMSFFEKPPVPVRKPNRPGFFEKPPIPVRKPTATVSSSVDYDELTTLHSRLDGLQFFDDLPTIPPIDDDEAWRELLKERYREVEVASILSHAVYAKTNQKLPPHMTEIATNIDEKTGSKVSVYKTNWQKEIFVVGRGTETNVSWGVTFKNLQEDLGLVFGMAPEGTYSAQREFIGQIVDQYSDYDIILGGHSLAASVLSMASSEFGIRAYVFDSPGLLNANSAYDLSLVTSFQAEKNVVNSFGKWPVYGGSFDYGNVVSLPELPGLPPVPRMVPGLTMASGGLERLSREINLRSHKMRNIIGITSQYLDEQRHILDLYLTPPPTWR